MEVEQTPLPGVGIRYDFATTAGRRLGLVIHRDGRTEIIIYSQDDPDNCSESVTLQPQECAALVELMATPPGQGDPHSRTHHCVWHRSEDQS